MKIGRNFLLIGFYALGVGGAYLTAWHYGREYFEYGARGPGLMALGSLMSALFLTFPGVSSAKYFAHPNGKVRYGAVFLAVSSMTLLFGSIGIFIIGYVMAFADAA